MRLQLSIFMFVATLLAACGGSGSVTTPTSTNTNASFVGASLSSSSSSTSSASTSSAVSSSFNANIVWPAVTASPGQILAVSSDGVIAANSVITFGQVFAPGEVTTGVVATTSGGLTLPTQVNIKRLHTGNASVRHAIISVQLPATTGNLSFSLTPSSTLLGGSGVSLSQALTSSVDYRVEISETGSSAEAGRTWSTTLKTALGASPTQWFAGPLSSEWRGRVAPTSSAQAHPGLRVLFDARYQSQTQGRVSIAIENVEATAGRGDRDYNLRIYDANNLVVYTVNNLHHYSQSRHRKILYFGSGVKEMIAVVDVERLKNARAIPNYPNMTIPSAQLDYYYNTAWGNSQRGLYQASYMTPNMYQTGGREDIGPQPTWVARALVSRDPRMYQIMFDLTERASYFNVHYRDPATNDIFSIDTRPNFTLFQQNPGLTGSYPGDSHNNAPGDALPATSLALTAPPNWSVDSSHEPAFAYLPYLITGDHYYLDELYFWANALLLQWQPAYRGYADGLIWHNQVRGQAWDLRTLGHAAWVSPDADWQKDYFTDKVNKNLDWYINTNMANNTMGFFLPNNLSRFDGAPYVNTTNTATVYSPWQHAFLAYSLAELCYKGYSNACTVRDWALNLTVKLFTSPDNVFNKFDGATGYITSNINGSGGSWVPLTNLSQVSFYTFENRTTQPSVLGGLYNDGYGAIAYMALATAVDANIPNASQGFVFVHNQLMGAGSSVIQDIQKSPTFNIIPFGAISGLSTAPGIYAH